MPRKPCNGNANQLWIYDQESGFISAFETDSINIGNGVELTLHSGRFGGGIVVLPEVWTRVRKPVSFILV